MASSTPVMTGATAPRLQPVAQLHIQNDREATAERAAPDLAKAYQKSLFDDRKVLTFPQAAPPKAARTRAVETAPRPKKPRPAVEGQGQLDFLPSAPAKPRQLGTTVDAVIFCEFPVATPMHRAVAALVDWALVTIGYGLFVGLFLLLGGQIAFAKTDLAMFAGMFLLVGFTYGMLFAVAGTETVGMRAVRLRLTTFDGFPPDQRQRLVRFCGACMTRCTLLGLLWCLADEESLAWQDHISRTFPTPDDTGSVMIRRV
ncbi:MAG: RDD family protein [Acidobacteria bacterium]|nr:RDD family protein [Acidobacteriota bacterium]